MRRTLTEGVHVLTAGHAEQVLRRLGAADKAAACAKLSAAEAAADDTALAASRGMADFPLAQAQVALVVLAQAVGVPAPAWLDPREWRLRESALMTEPQSAADVAALPPKPGGQPDRRRVGHVGGLVARRLGAKPCLGRRVAAHPSRHSHRIAP